MDTNKKNLMWYNVALMAYATVWGFGNVVNNFTAQGIQVIFSWILIMVIYFIPYVLMVGELGSTFKNSGAGVSSWIKETTTPKLAFLAAWTYWVVHIPYLAQKPQSGLTALGWVLTQSSDFTSNFSPLVFQSVTLAVLIGFILLASRGIKSIKILGTIAGTSMLVMSLLYVVMGISALLFMDVDFATKDITVKSLVPTFNFSYITTFSLLVFSVGGAEKLSPYVNQLEKPGKNFPKAMLALGVLVMISAIFGSIAMAGMFDANNLPEDLMMNGQYYAFQMLGEYYHMGNVFMIIYALANTLAQFSALLISIDAPLRILTMDADHRYVPKALMKTNKHGAPTRAYIMSGVLSGILIMLPTLGSGNMAELVVWFTKLNSIVMPMRYLWVFVAYYMLKKFSQRYNSEYKFIKSDSRGKIIAIWCFVFTAFACILGMVPEVEPGSADYTMQLTLNILTPVVLIGLGFIMPLIAKLTNNK